MPDISRKSTPYNGSSELSIVKTLSVIFASPPFKFQEFAGCLKHIFRAGKFYI